jgi:hypothetical protein
MQLDGLLKDAEHWRARAEQTRSLVRLISDREAGAILLRVAAEYERLAEHAEEPTSRAAEPDDKVAGGA